VLAADSAPLPSVWGSVLGLQGILTARGRLAEVKRLLDSSVTSGVMAAKGLYVLHAAAGLGMDAEAEKVIAELSGDYRKMGAGRLWYHGIWLAHRGDTTGLDQVANAAVRLAETSQAQLDISTARSIVARRALLRADTAQAITLLKGVTPAGDGSHIEWGMQEPFGQEQLLLAELLLARGQARESIEAASHLDHPRPIIYLMYLRQSLEFRRRATEHLGDSAAASTFRIALARLR
jgi:hypothetical protein